MKAQTCLLRTRQACMRHAYQCCTICSARTHMHACMQDLEIQLEPQKDALVCSAYRLEGWAGGMVHRDALPDISSWEYGGRQVLEGRSADVWQYAARHLDKEVGWAGLGGQGPWVCAGLSRGAARALGSVHGFKCTHDLIRSWSGLQRQRLLCPIADTVSLLCGRERSSERLCAAPAAGDAGQ